MMGLLAENVEDDIAVLKKSPTWLMCKKCGQVWNPLVRASGRPLEKYWHCPHEHIHQ